MANEFATVEDLNILWRPIEDDEKERVNTLLSLVSDCLRVEANKVGRDLDEMISNTPALASVAKSVTVDVVRRYMNDNQDSVSMSQMSQSAGGYTVSGTFLVPGGGLFIKKNELTRLGLRRQRFGVIDLYEPDKGNEGNPV